MEFDKSKVYTALNADEVKVGSKGYFADTISQLKMLVEQHCEGYGEVDEIFPDSSDCRFNNKGDTRYSLFYLVAEPQEKEFRPYKDTDEIRRDFESKYSVRCVSFAMPQIWIKNKANKADVSRVITGFHEDGVSLCSNFMSFEQLLDSWTYLDGSPCGIEE